MEVEDVAQQGDVVLHGAREVEPEEGARFQALIDGGRVHGRGDDASVQA